MNKRNLAALLAWMAPMGILVILVASIGVRLVVRPQSIAVHEPFYSKLGRELFGAQAAYQDAFGCFAGRLECLAKPSDCDPSVSATAPAFLEPGGTSLANREGYSIQLSPGDPIPDCKASAGVDSYAYILIPDRATAEDAPGFCADHTGRLCFTPDGSAPEVRDARCVVTSGEPPGWLGSLLTGLGLRESPQPRACYLAEWGDAPKGTATRQ